MVFFNIFYGVPIIRISQEVTCTWLGGMNKPAIDDKEQQLIPL